MASPLPGLCLSCEPLHKLLVALLTGHGLACVFNKASFLSFTIKAANGEPLAPVVHAVNDSLLAESYVHAAFPLHLHFVQ